jgi:hypothetical protein
MGLTDWLLVDVALLFIGLAKFSLTKSGFNHPSVIESPLRLPPLRYECAENWAIGSAQRNPTYTAMIFDNQRPVRY